MTILPIIDQAMEEAIQSGDYLDAQMKLEAAIDENPQNVQLWNSYARLSGYQGRLDCLFNFLLKQHEKNPQIQTIAAELSITFSQGRFLDRVYPNYYKLMILNFVSKKKNLEQSISIICNALKLSHAGFYPYTDYSLIMCYLATLLELSSSDSIAQQKALEKLKSDPRYSIATKLGFQFITEKSQLAFEELRPLLENIKHETRCWHRDHDHKDAWINAFLSFKADETFNPFRDHINQSLIKAGIDPKKTLVFTLDNAWNVGDNFTLMGLMASWHEHFNIQTIPLLKKGHHDWIAEIYQERFPLVLWLDEQQTVPEWLKFIPLRQGEIVSLTIFTGMFPGRRMMEDSLSNSREYLKMNTRSVGVNLTPPSISKELREKAKSIFATHQLIEGKCVFISTTSRSMNALCGTDANLKPFWNALTLKLKAHGLTPVFNQRIGGKLYHYPSFAQIDLSLDLVIPFVELCGHFISARSGLCDLISFAQAKRYVVYPVDLVDWSCDLASFGVKSIALKLGQEKEVADQIMTDIENDNVEDFKNQKSSKYIEVYPDYSQLGARKEMQNKEKPIEIIQAFSHYSQGIYDLEAQLKKDIYNSSLWSYYMIIKASCGQLSSGLEFLISHYDETAKMKSILLAIASRHKQAHLLFKLYPNFIEEIIIQNIRVRSDIKIWLRFGRIAYDYFYLNAIKHDYSLVCIFLGTLSYLYNSSDPRNKKFLLSLSKASLYQSAFKHATEIFSTHQWSSIQSLQIALEDIQQKTSCWAMENDHRDPWIQTLKNIEYMAHDPSATEAVYQELKKQGIDHKNSLLVVTPQHHNIGDNLKYYGILANWKEAYNIDIIPIISADSQEWVSRFYKDQFLTSLITPESMLAHLGNRLSPISRGSTVKLLMEHGIIPGRRSLHPSAFDHGAKIYDHRVQSLIRSPNIDIRRPKINENDAKNAQTLFHQKGLSLGRCVLISTSSNVMHKVSFSNITLMPFWKKLIDALKNHSLTPILNQRRNNDLAQFLDIETVDLPIELVIPFIELCGGFIGARSGLCDLAAFAETKKYTVYPIQAINFGCDLARWGMKSVELRYGEEDQMIAAIVDDIINGSHPQFKNQVPICQTKFVPDYSHLI